MYVDGIYDLFEQKWFVILFGLCFWAIVVFVGTCIRPGKSPAGYYYLGNMTIYLMIYAMMNYEARFSPRYLAGMAICLLVVYIILAWTLKFRAQVEEAELFLKYLPEVKLECDPNDAARGGGYVRIQTIIDLMGIGISSIDRQELKNGVVVKLQIADSHRVNYDNVIGDLESWEEELKTRQTNR